MIRVFWTSRQAVLFSEKKSCINLALNLTWQTHGMFVNTEKEIPTFLLYVWQRSRGRAGVYRGPRHFPSLGRFMTTLLGSHHCRAPREVTLVAAGVLQALSLHRARRKAAEKAGAAASPVLGPRQDGDPWPCGGKGSGRPCPAV